MSRTGGKKPAQISLATQPSLEIVVQLIGARYGAIVALFCSSSTMFLSFPPSTLSHMVHADNPGFTLSKIVTFTQICERAAEQVPDPRAVSSDLNQLLLRPPLYPAGLTFICHCLTTFCFCFLYGVGYADLPITLGLGVVVALISTSNTRGVHLSRGRDMILAAVVTLIVVCINRYFEISVIPVILSGISWRLPGFTIVLSLNDLATGHLLPGTTKLMSSFLVCLNFGFGILAGLACNGLVKGDLEHENLARVPLALTAVSLLFTVALMGVLLDANAWHYPQLAFSAALAYFSSVAMQDAGAPLAAFSAALLTGLAGNVYGRVTRNPSIEFVFFGIMLVVPGSVGVKGVLAPDAETATTLLYTVIAIALAIVAGFFASSLILPPRRAA